MTVAVAVLAVGVVLAAVVRVSMGRRTPHRDREEALRVLGDVVTRVQRTQGPRSVPR